MTRLLISRKASFIAIFLANVLVCFHYYTIIYVNSSYLGTFFKDPIISALYVAGSVLSLFLFFQAPKILARTGTYGFLLSAIVLEGIAISGLALTQEAFFAASLFVIHQAMIAMTFFGLDLYLEAETKKESQTGELRGAYLTLGNTALIFSPLIASFLLKEDTYSMVYFLSAALTIPLILLIMGPLHSTAVPIPHKTAFWSSLKEILRHKTLRAITITHLILQIFYGWMVIYIPLYLHNSIGFSWSVIGVIFTIMLLPFVLFELPAGILADKKWGEKEIMIIGLFATAASLFLIPFLTTPSFSLWAAVLFLSRAGASLVEITTESAFFKHVSAAHSNLISLFRSTRAMGYIIAPTLGGILLFFIPYPLTFPILGLVVSLGILSAWSIRDTK